MHSEDGLNTDSHDARPMRDLQAHDCVDEEGRIVVAGSSQQITPHVNVQTYTIYIEHVESKSNDSDSELNRFNSADSRTYNTCVINSNGDTLSQGSRSIGDCSSGNISSPKSQRQKLIDALKFILPLLVAFALYLKDYISKKLVIAASILYLGAMGLYSYYKTLMSPPVIHKSKCSSHLSWGLKLEGTREQLLEKLHGHHLTELNYLVPEDDAAGDGQIVTDVHRGEEQVQLVS